MRVVGNISGTSADAIEAVLCEIQGAPPRLELSVLAGRTVPYPLELQRRVHANATIEGSDVEAICLLDAEIGERFASAALDLIADAGSVPDEVDLIGSHGQTIWHAVRADGSVAGTIQVGDAAVIAERTGISVVHDFRSRDIAAGGQGAPIVAYVDWLLFRHPSAHRAVQNLGGIGNVAYLPPLDLPDAKPLAFDTGPANVLIDVLVTLLTDGQATSDVDGAMAARGRIDEAWVTRLLEHPYLVRRPPKTTGRELFSPAYGAQLLEEGRSRGLADADIVASVTAFSADTVVDQYRRFLPVQPDEVVAAGGGTRNPMLMARLRERLPAPARLLSFEDLGHANHQKEAMAMAVLAYETWHGRTGTLPELTGASRAVVMGSITPGRRPAGEAR
jgi:anhydro-N-acetylmuramic acid kinase